MRKFIIRFLLVVAMLSFSVVLCKLGVKWYNSPSFELTWNASKDKDVVGYIVYWTRVDTGLNGQHHQYSRDVGNKTSTKINRMVPGGYYFSVVAYDRSGIESEPAYFPPFCIPEKKPDNNTFGKN